MTPLTPKGCGLQRKCFFISLLLISQSIFGETNEWLTAKIPKGARLVTASWEIAVFISPDGKQAKLPIVSLDEADQKVVNAFSKKQAALISAPRRYTNDPSITWKEGVNDAEPPYMPKTRYKLPMRDGKIHGVAQWRTEEGKLVFLEQYENGVLFGEKIQYYPNGQPYAIFYFENGKANGQSITFFPGATIARAIDFKDGEPTGMFFGYYPSGQMKHSYPQINGENHGKSYHFLSDGVIFATQTWKEGKLVDKEEVLEASAAELREYKKPGVADLGVIWGTGGERSLPPDIPVAATPRAAPGPLLLKVTGGSRRDLFGIPEGGIIGKVDSGAIVEVVDSTEMRGFTWFRVSSRQVGTMYTISKPARELQQGWLPESSVQAITSNPR